MQISLFLVIVKSPLVKKPLRAFRAARSVRALLPCKFIRVKDAARLANVKILAAEFCSEPTALLRRLNIDPGMLETVRRENHCARVAALYTPFVLIC